MKEYFQLQFKMSNRKLKEFGLSPFVAYSLLLICFTGFSIFLFSKTEFAQYYYILMALGLLSKLTNKKRNEFLKSCFTEKDYLKLRFLENLILIFPFAFFLAYKQFFAFIPILLALASLLAFVNLRTNFNFIVPTPFYKKPFEFTVGFRNTFYFFPMAYCLSYISISVDNFSLGIFSMVLIFLISLSYYSKLENEYFIWSYSLNPKAFLAEKIKTGFFYTTLLSIPTLIPLAIYFNGELESLLTFFFLGYAYLMTVILAKYSVYPNEMHIPEGILIALSLAFPPFLIVVGPYFYYQSKKRLNATLQ